MYHPQTPTDDTPTRAIPWSPCRLIMNHYYSTLETKDIATITGGSSLTTPHPPPSSNWLVVWSKRSTSIAAIAAISDIAEPAPSLFPWHNPTFRRQCLFFVVSSCLPLTLYGFPLPSHATTPLSPHGLPPSLVLLRNSTCHLSKCLFFGRQQETSDRRKVHARLWRWLAVAEGLWGQVVATMVAPDSQEKPLQDELR